MPARVGTPRGQRRNVSGQPTAARTHEEEHPLAGDLHPDALVDEACESRRAAQLEDVPQALRVLLQELDAKVLDGRLPRITQRCGEEDQRGEGEQDVAGGESGGG